MVIVEEALIEVGPPVRPALEERGKVVTVYSLPTLRYLIVDVLRTTASEAFFPQLVLLGQDGRDEESKQH